MRLVTPLMISNSWNVFDSTALSSRTFAQARIPYTGIPNCENIAKYEITEVAKETLPVPRGKRILDT